MTKLLSLYTSLIRILSILLKLPFALNTLLILRKHY